MSPSIQSSLYVISPIITIAVFTLVACSSVDEVPQVPSSGSAASSSAPVVQSSVASSVFVVPSSPQTSRVQHRYIDGTYVADGAYRSPSGEDHIKVSLTLKGDSVMSATYEGLAVTGKSKIFQEKFGSGFQEAVIGKNIEDLALTVVNGSSLTPKGFMDALEKIKTDAKAS